MSEFQTFLTLGFEHIADLGAYDHILFIVALCAVYQIKQWRQVLVLVTAFTIGHSTTLALATLGVIIIPSDIVEFLIPVTIFITAMVNVFSDIGRNSQKRININYLLPLFFGLIHGLGFSNYLRMLLGKEENIISPLLAFNVGLEIGQIIIVMFILVSAYFVLNIFGARRREWNLFISGAAAGIALLLIKEAAFW